MMPIRTCYSLCGSPTQSMIQKLSRTFCVCTCVFTLLYSPSAHAADERERIQHVVDELKTELRIPQTVAVRMVETNPRLFSVAPVQQQPATSTFLLSVEEDFARALTDAELKAAVAHELG